MKFQCLENVLANSAKADSETIAGVHFEWFKGFVSNGASVMVGEMSGMASRLKADERIQQSKISIHCVHNLALAITGTIKI